jgi:arylsulfatase A-like enzyme
MIADRSAGPFLFDRCRRPGENTADPRPGPEIAAMLRIAFVALVALGCTSRLTAGPPNVVFILTDNHGAWTLGCYGNKDIRTPNIDRLAREGTLFERSYSSNAVCSPTRATYLTGLMPSQHGVHSYLGAGGAQTGPKAYCTVAEFRTLPKILKDAGYVCGLSGKWHLGGNLTPQEGFTAWATMPTGHTSTFYNAEVIEGGKVHKEPEYLTDYWTDHAVRFIKANRDRPFFLFLAYNGPYGLGASLNHPARNRHAKYYADKDLPSFPRETMHPWLHANKQFLNNVGAMRRYAAEVSGVDDGVGRVMQTLKEQGLDDNTLVVFTGDQGLAGGQSGFWGMGDHTRPLTAYDWTMHVPLIWRYPGHVPAGRRSDLLVSNYDFLPTLLDYLGLKDKQADKPPSPGRSYAAPLRGKKADSENIVFYEFESVRAVRTDRWKLITRHPDGPNELYDLKADPGERRNLVDQDAHATTREELQKRLDAFFARYVDPQYDLWHGGRSKAGRLSTPKKK